MLSVSIKLCGPWRNPLLQASFLAALQRKGKLQPFNQVGFNETSNRCSCSRILIVAVYFCLFGCVFNLFMFDLHAFKLELISFLHHLSVLLIEFHWVYGMFKISQHCSYSCQPCWWYFCFDLFVFIRLTILLFLKSHKLTILCGFDWWILHGANETVL